MTGTEEIMGMALWAIPVSEYETDLYKFMVTQDYITII